MARAICTAFYVALQLVQGINDDVSESSLLHFRSKDSANMSLQVFIDDDDEATASCPGLKAKYFEQHFKGRKFSITQTSTLHGRAKYTYEIKIGGGITQKTSDAGKYFIGKHLSYGDSTEKFGNGDRCGGTPRSATVTYTYGSSVKLLSAYEPRMCVYAYKVQLLQSDCDAAKLLACKDRKVSDFAGKDLRVTQTSTLHGRAKYTYHIKIGGDIIQKTSDAGNYFIGRHQSYGRMTETFGNGDRCGRTPRSATIKYTFGKGLKLLRASEPRMCVYEYRIQLPQSEC